MNKTIIDGISVSKCEFLRSVQDKQICHCIKSGLFGMIEFVENTKNKNCEENPDCYFKQLKRKEQEYEDYKIANAELEKENDELLKFKEMQEKELLKLRGQLQAKEQLEEIKKEFQVECLQDNITGKRTYRSLKVIKLKEELEEDFEETKEDLRECEFDRNIAQLEANKYKQALDEIDELIKSESCVPCKELEENSCDECHASIILDIINKAKKE